RAQNRDPEDDPQDAAPKKGSAKSTPAASKDPYGNVPMFGPAQLDLDAGASTLVSSGWTSRIITGVAMVVVAMMGL
ncbi:hypothetical protein BGZ49_002578, partial [Haplosporangium sp. Z 27]